MTGAPVTLVDGVPVATVAVDDRGLAYGDGLFTTVALRAGLPCLWSAHQQRLEEGCHALGMPAPDLAVLRTEAARLIPPATDGVLKILLSRGSGGAGYRPPAAPALRRVLSLRSLPPGPGNLAAVAVRWCRHPVSSNPALAGIKHLNRLDSVLARAEWQDDRIAEGLMCDGDGRVIEGTMSNLFVEQDGRLRTPSLQQAGVAGVVRALVMAEAAAQGIAVEVTTLTRADLAAAEALYLTNAVRGIWRVARLERQVFDLARAVHPALAAAARQVHRPAVCWWS